MVQWNLDAMFRNRSNTNIEKAFYKKRDLVDIEEESEDDEIQGKPILDSFGEELVDHKTANFMNNMLPGVKTLTGDEQTQEKPGESSQLGKRTASEANEGA